jgi:hypothetical protein
MSNAINGQKPGLAPKPTVEIKLDRHYKTKVYTSGSDISGCVVVKTPRDLAFDNFEIAFTGTAFTRLDFVQQYPTHTFRSFMKLRMPLTESDFPESRVFEAGKSYTIPFNFVVPHNLTISSCTHSCVSNAVKEQHLRLPPTVGFWEGDDQAPDMVHIEYAIKARAFKKPDPAAKQVKLMEGSYTVKVLPSLPEDAPLDITFRDERYKMEKSKTIRKSLFSPKTGQMTVATAQPGAIMLSADGRDASTTHIRANLEFAPSSIDTTPPKINSISAKLQAFTFFSAIPTDDMPNLGSRSTYSTTNSLSYSATTSLFTVPVNKVSWEQVPVSGGRRDSGYSSSHLDEGCSDSDGADGRGRRGSKSKSKKPQFAPIKHISSLNIPVSLPMSNKKFFLPTFHSCLISRTYTLQLTLNVGPTNTTMTLSIPVQVGVENIYEPHGGELPSFESVMAQDEQNDADAHLSPRLMQLPPPDTLRESVLPGYGSLQPVPVA